MSGTLESMQKADKEMIFGTYARYPIGVQRASGSRLWDFEGREYVDLLAGIAVTSLGHCHPELAETMAEQARKLVHVSNLFYQEEQLRMAREILPTAHFDKIFYCNSGAEANEGAVKLARRYQQKIKNKDAFELITFREAFHGRTLAMLAATGQAYMQEGFAPIPQEFRQIPGEDLDLLEKSIHDKTAGVLLEIVQGEGGVRPFSQEFVQGVQKICRAKDVLFMVDEIQCGMGRTGMWWAFQHYGVKPDVMTSAKALANGLPMGAILATEEVAQALGPGSHGTTFGGNAFVTAVAAKTMQIMKRDKLVERAAETGAWALERFRQTAAKFPESIREVRGMGLMIGIDLAFPGKDIWAALLEKGFVLNLTHDTVLRLLPALNIEKDDLEAFAQTLERLLQK